MQVVYILREVHNRITIGVLATLTDGKALRALGVPGSDFPPKYEGLCLAVCPG